MSVQAFHILREMIPEKRERDATMCCPGYTDIEVILFPYLHWVFLPASFTHDALVLLLQFLSSVYNLAHFAVTSKQKAPGFI